MSPAIEAALAAAAPEIVRTIEDIILAILHRDDPLTAAEWHLRKAAHDLAVEKVLTAEKVL